jgi:AdoMet-dependent heme synthase
MKSVRVVVIRLLEACNAGCFMCTFARSEDEYRFTADDARRLAQEMDGTTVRLVRFTGGEPLLLADISEVIGAFSAIGVLTSVITNGWYLAPRIYDLRNGSISQVIVSIDAASAGKHDRYRRREGLFERALAGIRAARAELSSACIRVNTVINPGNVSDLIPLHDLLKAEGVDQWSLIPLKWKSRGVAYRQVPKLVDEYERFRAHVATSPGPRILGEGRSWAGRNPIEMERFLSGQGSFTPAGICRVVNQVRYLTPKDGMVFPCNCVPHRMNAVELGWRAERHLLDAPGAKQVVEWLKVEGPRTCTGCEPVNVALGEGNTDLNVDPLAF